MPVLRAGPFDDSIFHLRRALSRLEERRAGYRLRLRRVWKRNVRRRYLRHEHELTARAPDGRAIERMRARILPRSVCLALCVALGLFAFAQRNKKNTEPKTQVLPLPPELPMALVAETKELDFHISPLLRTGGLAAQIRQSLADLIRDTHGETIIKLRAFVAGAGDARRVQAVVAELFTERKLPLPVLSILQVGSLGEQTAQVVIEAVVSTHKTVNPNGLAFLAGQTGATLQGALDRMSASARAANVAPGRVLTCTCFTSRIEDAASAQALVRAAFPNSAVNVVEALRDPASDASTCEAVGQLNAAAADPVTWLKNSRVAMVTSKRLVFTGLQLTFGSYLDDAHEAFARLQRAASALQPVEAAVEVNAFSLNPYAGSALRKTTPVPASVFTVQLVEGLPSIDASAGIEAVMAPNVPAPVSLPD
jgi:enamine deaminase RidA (YjgF/YER057c/UK114 family)